METDRYWRDLYNREVLGLNNEGDPIGGEGPRQGYKAQVARLTAELDQARRERDELVKALQEILDNDPTPDRNCSCHINPPCNDCIDYGEIRESTDEAHALLKKLENKP